MHSTEMYPPQTSRVAPNPRSLDSGETISLKAGIDGSRMSGSVINTTSGLQSTFDGTATSQQITGEFSGAGPGQTIKGVFTIYRWQGHEKHSEFEK